MESVIITSPNIHAQILHSPKVANVYPYDCFHSSFSIFSFHSFIFISCTTDSTKSFSFSSFSYTDCTRQKQLLETFSKKRCFGNSKCLMISENHPGWISFLIELQVYTVQPHITMSRSFITLF